MRSPIKSYLHCNEEYIIFNTFCRVSSLDQSIASMAHSARAHVIHRQCISTGKDTTRIIPETERLSITQSNQQKYRRIKTEETARKKQKEVRKRNCWGRHLCATATLFVSVDVHFFRFFFYFIFLLSYFSPFVTFVVFWLLFLI